MHYLLLAYITLFSLGFAALFVIELMVTEPEEREPPLETFLDFLLVILLFAGMLLLAAGVDSAALKHAWKGVSVLLAVFAVISNLRGRHKDLQDPEVAEDRSLVAFADVGTLLMLLPAIGFNLYYAFSG